MALVDRLHRLGTRARHTPPFNRLEPVWRAVETPWNRLLHRATRDRGLVAWINDDELRLTYEYGARYEKSGYEPIVHERVTRHIRPGQTVLDVGAHVGFFTLAAALRVGPQGKVYAFEPAPETSAILERHVALNGWQDRVEIVRSVASDSDGTVPFFVHGDTMSAALVRENLEELSPQAFDTPPVQIDVPSVTLDGFCASRGVQPALLKIDVEGAEVLVLRGAKELLTGPLDVVCEVHPAHLANFGCSYDDLEALASGSGRTIERIDEPNELGIFHVLLPRANGRPSAQP